MNLEKLLFQPAVWIAGEIRQTEGAKSMCIKGYPQSRGTWATEGRYVQFSTCATRGYLQGRCVKVDGQRKTVSIQVSRGIFDLGSIVVLTIDEIGRYEDVSGEEADLIAQALATILENGVSVGGPTMDSLRELEVANTEAKHADFEARMGVLLGDGVYQWLTKVEPVLRELTLAVSGDTRARKEYPSPKIASRLIKMRKLIASAPPQLLKGRPTE